MTEAPWARSYYYYYYSHLFICLVVIIIMISSTSMEPSLDRGSWARVVPELDTGVCEKTLLRRGIDIGVLAFRAPNQGLDCSLCLWTAGHGLA